MNNIEFGILLKTLRKQKQMTQENLASLLNVSTSAVCKWEKGINLPDVNMFQKLSEILDISLDDLHNPEEALQQLRSQNQEIPSLVHAIGVQAIAAMPVEDRHIEKEQIVEKQLEESLQPVKKARSSSKRLRIIILAVTILTLAVVGMLLYLHIRESNNLHIYPYSFRIAEDAYYGTVYEVAYIYEGNFDSLSMDDPFIIQLSIDWVENEKISSEITIMKASFYPDKELAEQWTTPTYSTYFLR